MLGNQKLKIKNQKYIWDKRKIKYWMPVDWYNGGMEHTTLHLLYSRFCYKVLSDIGAVLFAEPYKKRTSHGMVLGEGRIKMSKSKGNVINPDEVVKDEGADTLRVYEMFMGPFGEAISWNKKGVKGVKRFLDKIWQLSNKYISENQLKSAQISDLKENQPKSASISGLKRELHKTIKKVSEDIENLKFNTAVSSMMKFCNLWSENPSNLEKEDFENFLKILSPFAPHLSEELYHQLTTHNLQLTTHNLQLTTHNLPRSRTPHQPAPLRGARPGSKHGTGQASSLRGRQLTTKSIFEEPWPKYDKEIIKEKKFLLIIQVNGKVRDKIEISVGIRKEEAEKIALSTKKIKKGIGDKKIKKTVFVPNKLINFVV